MRLIIVRHGETIENQKGIIQGQRQGMLSKNGKEQAKKLALRLRSEKINFIYSSDLARAKDTTKEIRRFHQKVPIEYLKELRERNFGEFEGKTKKELGLMGEEQSIISYPQDGESDKQLFDRAKSFTCKILDKHNPNEIILIVCHTGIKKALICVITGKGAKNIPSMENFKNTAISVLKVDKDKGYKIHIFNYTEHLK